MKQWKMNLIAAGITVTLVGSVVVWGVNQITARAQAAEVKKPPIEASQAPVNPSSNIRFDSPEGRAIATVEEFHQKFNTYICYENDKDYVSPDSPKWDEFLKRPELNPESYRELTKSLDGIQGAGIDLRRLADLATIAHEKHDVKALIYMHRILHDLDYWAFMQDGIQGVDFWGVTETAPPKDEDNRGELAAYLEKNKK